MLTDEMIDSWIEWYDVEESMEYVEVGIWDLEDIQVMACAGNSTPMPEIKAFARQHVETCRISVADYDKSSGDDDFIMLSRMPTKRISTFKYAGDITDATVIEPNGAQRMLIVLHE